MGRATLLRLSRVRTLSAEKTMRKRKRRRTRLVLISASLSSPLTSCLPPSGVERRPQSTQASCRGFLLLSLPPLLVFAPSAAASECVSCSVGGSTRRGPRDKRRRRLTRIRKAGGAHAAMALVFSLFSTRFLKTHP